MPITSFFTGFFLIPAMLSLFGVSAFGLAALVADGLYRIFIEFTLSFFLVLFLLRNFLLTLLKIKIRFSHWIPPEEEVCTPTRALRRAGQKTSPLPSPCEVPARSPSALGLDVRCSG